SNRITEGFMIFLQWLPLMFFPIVISQIYSTSESIGIDTFFIVLRRRMRCGEKIDFPSINLTYPFLMLCMVAAGSANDRSMLFYTALTILSAWALWPIRSERYPLPLWLGLLLLVSAIGYWGQFELHALQRRLETFIISWMSLQETDPYRSSTAIGDIGKLKQSGRILFRVRKDQENGAPILLRDASYNLYQRPNWLASSAAFRPVQHDADGTTWTLQEGIFSNQAVTVSTYLRGGHGILALPNSTFQIRDLPVMEMLRNRMGDVKVEFGPGFVSYRAQFDQDASLDSLPNNLDLIIPHGEAPAITKIASELELETKSPHEALETVKDFFQKKFNYSLLLGGTSLEEFLLRSQSGHCEYFATATVFLLRKAGIPARYATGYSVQEYKPAEKMFIVRERHAHAWVLAYVDGAWHNVDTTPAVWAIIEEGNGSMWEPLSDLWSRGVFLFTKWRWREKDYSFMKTVGWFLAFLIPVLAWHFYLKDRLTLFIKERKDRRIKRYAPNIDSDFYLIVRRLHALGLGREPWEPLLHWIKRIGRCELPPESIESLQSIVDLHYRYRFDPKKLSIDERLLLKRRVQSWLGEHPIGA
ncbi:MAG: transglutaminase family protein, partial [Nitrospiria bacterium]